MNRQGRLWALFAALLLGSLAAGCQNTHSGHASSEEVAPVPPERRAVGGGLFLGPGAGGRSGYRVLNDGESGL
jgi:hypothetical protein